MARLDQEILARGLLSTRTRAVRAIKDGYVLVNGNVAYKPSKNVNASDSIAVNDPAAQWVSRAALKILKTLENHPNAIALDLGASTGGFTQALLSHGVRKVFAVDVGHDQLSPSLKDDPRVVLKEGVNAKDITATTFLDDEWPDFDIITSDLSFISLRKALPETLDLARDGTILYALIKPQFELEPAKIGKGGIVKNETDQELAVQLVKSWLEEKNWETLSISPSPILGGDGNQEFIVKSQKLEEPLS